MSWLTKQIARAVAGKQLDLLFRLQTDLQLYRRWLAEFPEIALLLDNIAANYGLPGGYDTVTYNDVSKLREKMRGMVAYRQKMLPVGTAGDFIPMTCHDAFLQQELAKLQAERDQLLAALEELEHQGWFRYIVSACEKETERSDLYAAVTQARAALAAVKGGAA